jgi:hypothetical protein
VAAVGDIRIFGSPRSEHVEPPPNFERHMQQKQDTAVVMHLCGAGARALYAKRGFRLLPGRRCGDHFAQAYFARVNAMKRMFRRLADKSRRTTSIHDVSGAVWASGTFPTTGWQSSNYWVDVVFKTRNALLV